jgi:hypothetical protein
MLSSCPQCRQCLHCAYWKLFWTRFLSPLERRRRLQPPGQPHLSARPCEPAASSPLLPGAHSQVLPAQHQQQRWQLPASRLCCCHCCWHRCHCCCCCCCCFAQSSRHPLLAGVCLTCAHHRWLYQPQKVTQTHWGVHCRYPPCHLVLLESWWLRLVRCGRA